MSTARDIMTASPATVRPTSTLRHAVDLLETLDVRHLPVVNEVNEVIGMLSDRDLRSLDRPIHLGTEHASSLGPSGDTRVATVMSSDVLSVDLAADMAEIVDLMLEHKVGAVPVTDASGSLVGIVSYIDILRSLPADTERI